MELHKIGSDYIVTDKSRMKSVMIKHDGVDRLINTSNQIIRGNYAREGFVLYKYYIEIKYSEPLITTDKLEEIQDYLRRKEP